MIVDNSVDILVVEDNDSERASIVESLRAAVDGVSVAAVANQKEALDFLFRRGDWMHRTETDPPSLILLDLGLPDSDGLSILGEIRSLDPDDALTLTPVVIFTDSHATTDISRSYRCGANSYVIKPLSFADFQAVVEAVGRYWVKHNRVHA
ncbi:response regulator [bacterium]|nr:response regulator [bacterium]